MMEYKKIFIATKYISMIVNGKMLSLKPNDILYLDTVDKSLLPYIDGLVLAMQGYYSYENKQMPDTTQDKQKEDVSEKIESEGTDIVSEVSEELDNDSQIDEIVVDTEELDKTSQIDLDTMDLDEIIDLLKDNDGKIKIGEIASLFDIKSGQAKDIVNENMSDYVISSYNQDISEKAKDILVLLKEKLGK
jgi:hypothetical protein